MKKSALLFLIPFLLLPSCGKEKPNPSFDGNYFRYPEPKYKVLNYGESIVIDFEKELFSDGTMSTIYEERIPVKEKYDSIGIAEFPGTTDASFIQVKQLSPFKYRFTNRNTTEDCLKYGPRTYFYNKKSNTYGSAEMAFHLFFQPKEESIVKISNLKDFEKIRMRSSVRLCADIDMTDYNKMKQQLIDTDGKGTFSGCFLNPDHHVIRNWTLDDDGSWHGGLFDSVICAVFDSLVFENISYQCLEKPKFDFGLISRTSEESHYQNIIIRNLNCEVLGGSIGSLIGSSYQDSYTGCDIESTIINHGKGTKLASDHQVGGLAAKYSLIYDNYCYPWTEEKSFREYFRKFRDNYPKEEACRLAEEEIDRYAYRYSIKNNRLKVHLKSPGYCAGGLFGTAPMIHYSDTNIVEGSIEGYRSGTYRGTSEWQWYYYERTNSFVPDRDAGE